MPKLNINIDFDTMSTPAAVFMIDDLIDELHRIREQVLENESEEK